MADTHDIVQDAVCRTLHVGMTQRRQDFGLALETRDAIGVSSEDGDDHLHGNVAAQPRTMTRACNSIV